MVGHALDASSTHRSARCPWPPTSSGVCGVRFGAVDGAESGRRRRGAWPAAVDAAVRLLRGTLTDFTVPLSVRRGSEFERAVWRGDEPIPYGETRTYGEVAAAVGDPGAARAVGVACNRNPIAGDRAVPPHRRRGRQAGRLRRGPAPQASPARAGGEGRPAPATGGHRSTDVHGDPGNRTGSVLAPPRSGLSYKCSDPPGRRPPAWRGTTWLATLKAPVASARRRRSPAGLKPERAAPACSTRRRPAPETTPRSSATSRRGVRERDAETRRIARQIFEEDRRVLRNVWVIGERTVWPRRRRTCSTS